MSSNSLEIDLILNRKKYPKIYYATSVIIIILIIFIYLICTLKYETYYLNFGQGVLNEMKVLVCIDDLKYVINNNTIIIDNKGYHYQLSQIDDDLYVGEDYRNYKYVYLIIDNLDIIPNHNPLIIYNK